MYNMNMQNGHDAEVHTLNPTDSGICQAKLTEIHSSNISWHPWLAEILNSPISAETYYGQRVTTSVSRDTAISVANRGAGPLRYSFEHDLWSPIAPIYSIKGACGDDSVVVAFKNIP